MKKEDRLHHFRFRYGDIEYLGSGTHGAEYIEMLKDDYFTFDEKRNKWFDKNNKCVSTDATTEEPYAFELEGGELYFGQLESDMMLFEKRLIDNSKNKYHEPVL